MENSDILAKFIQNLQQVPYLASKNIYRVTSYFLEMEKEKCELFCANLLQMKDKLIQCNKCYIWQEKDKECSYCDSPKRDSSQICVVETWQDFLVIERSSDYNGIYHLLGGSIYPLEGIGPEDLKISELIYRVKIGNFKELILALNQTPEGEATAAYIADKLKNFDLEITCLAKGVPIGSSLEFLDRLTLNKALKDRRPF